MTETDLKTIIAAAFLFVAGCGGHAPYQVAIEPQGAKIVTGRFPVSLLESDSSFLWYPQNYSSFVPDSSSISSLSKSARNVRFVIVGGTWCGDTKRELPRFFKIMALAKIPPENIELYGVDRAKRSGDGISEKYDIVSVPTFILLSNGKEIGRIVEYPKRSLELDMVDLLQKK